MKLLYSLSISLFCIGVAVVLPFCSPASISTGPGTGSETTNGIMAQVRYQDGVPVQNAIVKLRPADYVKDTLSTSSNISSGAIDTITDSLGKINIDSLTEGRYVLEIRDINSGEGALVECDVVENSVNDCGIIFIDQLSSISGIIDTSALDTTASIYVQLYGMDIVKQVSIQDRHFTIDSIPSGNYALKVLTSIPSNMQEVISYITVPPNSSIVLDTIKIKNKKLWLYSQKVFLNTTGSGAGVSADIVRFPVLIRLTESNFDFLTALSDGNDIRFVKPDNTPLPFQIERWDRTAKRAEIWVRLDTVYGNNNTQYITMLWGNLNPPSLSNSNSVFDTSLGIQAAWHMGYSNGSTLDDASGNKFAAKCYSMSSENSVEGQIGYAQKFNGSTNYAVVTSTASGKLNFAKNGRYSISAWVYTEKLDSEIHSIVSKGNHQYGFQISKDNVWHFFEYKNRAGWEYTNAPATIREWQFVTCIRQGTTQRMYLNGEVADSVLKLKADTDLRITTDNVCIGKRTADSTQWFNGMIDELRIYSWPNSINWARLCYMNQKTDDALVVLDTSPVLGKRRY